MSATPIPRTLALTLYGDLAVSTLDELPPGRTPIATALCRESQRDARVRARARRGRGRAPGLRRLPAGRGVGEERRCAPRPRWCASWPTGPLAGLRLELVHGRMKADEKDAVMRRFKAGEFDVLVSTTVIEVGIDVPNATVIVDRARRALRAGAAPPAARPRRPRRGAGPLLPRGARLDGRGGVPAPARARAHDRRLPHRRGRSRSSAARATSSARARPGCRRSASPTCCATRRCCARRATRRRGGSSAIPTCRARSRSPCAPCCASLGRTARAGQGRVTDPVLVRVTGARRPAMALAIGPGRG